MRHIGDDLQNMALVSLLIIIRLPSVDNIFTFIVCPRKTKSYLHCYATPDLVSVGFRGHDKSL